MQAALRKFPFYLSWTLMASLCLFLVYMTLFYFSFSSTYNFLQVKQDVVYNVAWRFSFYTHITGGILSLLIGPFQLLPKLRQHYPKLHRVMGRIYVVGILFIGTPSGLYMAMYANGGILASVGFSILAVLWFTTTLLAVMHAINRNLKAHKQWMIRSFALTFAAVTLRLWVPILSLGFSVDPEVTVIATAWLSWVPNILFAEIIINKKKILSIFNKPNITTKKQSV